MITTKQVRKIMRKHSVSTIYTNKNKNSHTVKCYMPQNDVVAKALLADLKLCVNDADIKINCINNFNYFTITSIIVKCVKA